MENPLFAESDSTQFKAIALYDKIVEILSDKQRIGALSKFTQEQISAKTVSRFLKYSGSKAT